MGYETTSSHDSRKGRNPRATVWICWQSLICALERIKNWSGRSFLSSLGNVCSLVTVVLPDFP